MNYSDFINKYAKHPNYKAPTGTTLNAKSWQTEAPLRMFLNNLDKEVAENPEELVVLVVPDKLLEMWKLHKTSSKHYWNWMTTIVY